MNFQFTLKKSYLGKQSGLTLLELIIVITTIGIVSAVAASRFSSSADMNIANQADLLANDIRHVQGLAMSWGCELELNVTSNGYEVFSKTDYSAAGKSYCITGSPIVNPAFGKNFSVTVSYGITITPNVSIYFDSFGRPMDIAGNILSTANSFTLSADAESWQISIQPVSGWVSVSRL